MATSTATTPAAGSATIPEVVIDPCALATQIRQWGLELGFDAVGIAGVELGDAEEALDAWLAAGYHGEMDYMARHGSKRARPAELVPGTLSVISVRMNYWPEQGQGEAEAALHDGERAYLSRYALGRDYHKVLRARLQKLAERIEAEVGPRGHRVFVDSAPVLEVALAREARLGWRGKHTLLLNREMGSLFFLGELFLDLALPVDVAAGSSAGTIAGVAEAKQATDAVRAGADTAEPDGHCGRCTRCLDICPTQAFIAPYKLDARRCISYLTIELKGSIPEPLRPLMGNRIYGCDDCQLVCPWNRFARATREADFTPRHELGHARLAALFAWSETDFNTRMAGSAILRIGHERWLRNIAVALGNAPATPEVLAALRAREKDASALVREHVAWSLQRHAEGLRSDPHGIAARAGGNRPVGDLPTGRAGLLASVRELAAGVTGADAPAADLPEHGNGSTRPPEGAS